MALSGLLPNLGSSSSDVDLDLGEGKESLIERFKRARSNAATSRTHINREQAQEAVTRNEPGVQASKTKSKTAATAASAGFLSKLFKPKAEEPLEVVIPYKGGFWSIFSGLYGFLTWFGTQADQIEDVVTMGSRHLNNVDALTHRVAKEDLPQELQDEINYTYGINPDGTTAPKSLFVNPVTLWIADKLGFSKNKGPDGKGEFTIDGVTSFYGKLVQKSTHWFMKLVGLEAPFNLPTSGVDEPGSAGKPNGKFDFINYQDMSLGEDGKPKDPKGHIMRWTSEVNPDPAINAQRLKNLGKHIKEGNPWKAFKTFWKMLNIPANARNALSFIFGVSNCVEIALNPKPAKNSGFLGWLYNIPRVVGASFGSMIQPMFSFGAWLFGFTGNTNLIGISSLCALVGSIFMISSHPLDNAVRTLGAFGTMRKEGKTLKEAMKEMEIGWSDMFTGVFNGFITAIPELIGFFARASQCYGGARHFFAQGFSEYASIFHDLFSNLGLAKKDSKEQWQDFAKHKLIKNVFKAFKSGFVPAAESIVNAPIMKSLFKQIFPVVDKLGEDGRVIGERIPFNVYYALLDDAINAIEDPDYKPIDFKNFMGTPTVDKHASDSSKELADERNLLFGFIPKSEFLMYLYKVLCPWGGISLVIPYAFKHGFSDPVLQRHGSLPIKIVDRVTSFMNAMLAIPNLFYYSLTARFPQMVFGIYDLMQRYHDAHETKVAETLRGSDGKDLINEVTGEAVTYERDYDVMKEAVKPHVMKLLGSRFGLARYFGKILLQDILNNPMGRDVFKDLETANKFYIDYTDSLAFKIEYATEHPAILKYMRESTKWLMNIFPFLRNKRSRAAIGGAKA